MGREQRGFADFESVVEGFVADVGNVHHHAEAVHFADDLFAEIAEPVVNRFVGGGVGPLHIAAVRQRHVTHAQCDIVPENAEIARNHVAALDAEQSSDLAFLTGLANLGSSSSENQVAWMLAHLFANSVNLIEGALDGFRTGDLARHPNGKENGAESAFLHARDINTAARIGGSEIAVAMAKALV